MVLDTEYDCDGGRVRVSDCLARDTDRPTLVRLVEGLAGDVEMRMDLVVRFDYGHDLPWVRRARDAWRATAGPDGYELRTPVDLHGAHLATTARFTIHEGERVPFVLGWFPSHDPHRVPANAAGLVSATTRKWERWSSRCTYDGEWRDVVVRSLLTLEALTFAPTGGMVAAPTASLPESVGGSRNWDYRFCWLRDASLTLEALLLGGYRDEAQRWRAWLLRTTAGDPQSLQPLYGVAGERRLQEAELDWLPGYMGSRPVRAGNAAHQQLQLDVYGEVADVLWQSARAGIEPDADTWSLLELLLDALGRRWREPDEGIWEVRGGRQQFTHSKVMSWVAFDRAIALAERFGREGPVAEWKQTRDEIFHLVCDKGYNARLGAFTQTLGDDTLDAALLVIPLVGFLPGDDPRVVSTIEAVDKQLTVDGLVHRYQASDATTDGIGEPEGTFLPCTFWLVEALALAGRTDEARARFERVLRCANDVGLLAEEYDTDLGQLVGNFPQALTHLALVGAAHTLDPGVSSGRRRRRDRNHDRNHDHDPSDASPRESARGGT